MPLQLCRTHIHIFCSSKGCTVLPALYQLLLRVQLIPRSNFYPLSLHARAKQSSLPASLPLKALSNCALPLKMCSQSLLTMARLQTEASSCHALPPCLLLKTKSHSICSSFPQMILKQCVLILLRHHIPSPKVTIIIAGVFEHRL